MNIATELQEGSSSSTKISLKRKLCIVHAYLISTNPTSKNLPEY